MYLSLVIERWVEKPPPEYLQHIPVWVQLRNIPVNHYTVEAITAFGEFAGQVTEVTYDPLKPQNKDYVRVKVKFDVSKPLRRSKLINLPAGGTITILYDYERLQKRCYACQRLTHEQEKCPVVLRKLKGMSEEEKNLSFQNKRKAEPFIKESDPLFGVLSEEQVGLNPMTGRPRVAAEVLEGIIHYLLVTSEEERIARRERVKKSISNLANDPIGQKIMLRLEPAPLISVDLDKGKGHVFNFEAQCMNKSAEAKGEEAQKILIAAIRSGNANSRKPLLPAPMSDLGEDFVLESSNSSMSCPTVYRIGLNEASSSGILTKKGKPRKRPHKSKRRLKRKEDNSKAMMEYQKEGLSVGEVTKRKAEDEAEGKINKATRSNPLVVPNEELPKQ